MNKAYEPDDPAILVGAAVPDGDLDTMAAAIVEEFVRMGADDALLWRIFRSPTYRLTHAILCTRGEGYVQNVIEQARARWGYVRFTHERGHHG